ncbi:tRNA pseudouridine(55) synthase TruB [Lachnospiraceae bacterium C1.1]|nr:tRNA pseudouridine(55) synthase TruB [Lachnospiraceae bacterium C1.1]
MKQQNNYNGIIPIMKEAGYTSNDVVAKLRGILHMRKIGHTGTLDPDATGVLPVCLGRGTKLVSLLTDTDKEYLCRAKLGITTDTEDISGKITSEADFSDVTEEKLLEVMKSFVGEYDQIPPMFSAKKVNGKKLYELAREGKVIERKACRIIIKSLRLLSFENGEYSFLVECSKGTYIRSLCRDIGEKLGCGSAMLSLVRTRAGGFAKDEAITLDECEKIEKAGEFLKYLKPMDSVFEDYEKFTADEILEKKIRNGNSFTAALKDGKYRVYLPDGTFAAVYELENKTAKICGYFLT